MTNCSARPKSSPSTREMTDCRSSFFLDETRSSSPCTWARTPFGPTSLMSLEIFLASSEEMPSLRPTPSRYSLPEGFGSPGSRALSETPRLTSFSLNTSSTALARSSLLARMSMAWSPDQAMDAPTPRKSNRVPISLAVWLRALSTSCRSIRLTMSKEDSAGIVAPSSVGHSPTVKRLLRSGEGSGRGAALQVDGGRCHRVNRSRRWGVRLKGASQARPTPGAVQPRPRRLRLPGDAGGGDIQRPAVRPVPPALWAAGRGGIVLTTRRARGRRRRRSQPLPADRAGQGPGGGMRVRQAARGPLSFTVPSCGTAQGRLPERPKGAVCKTVGFAYVGSNPTPATTCENDPWPGFSRSRGLLLLAR